MIDKFLILPNLVKSFFLTNINVNSTGLIGGLFSKLFSLIWNVITWIGNLIWNAVKWVIDQIAALFNILFDILTNFFQLIFDLVAAVIYFVYNVGLLLVKFFELIIKIGQLLWSFVVGLTRTIGQLFYVSNGSTNAYSNEIGQVLTYASKYLQLSVLAYILLFLIWIGTAVSVVKLISSLKGE